MKVQNRVKKYKRQNKVQNKEIQKKTQKWKAQLNFSIK